MGNSEPQEYYSPPGVRESALLTNEPCKLARRKEEFQQQQQVMVSKWVLQDETLFLRLGKDHDWRKLSPAGVQEAVGQLLSLPLTTIEHIYRVPTGFALRAKDEETRQVLIDLAESFAPIGAKLEKASDLVVFRLPTVPVAIISILERPLYEQDFDYLTSLASQCDINLVKPCNSANIASNFTAPVDALVLLPVGIAPPPCTLLPSVKRTLDAVTAGAHADLTAETVCHAQPGPARPLKSSFRPSEYKANVTGCAQNEDGR
ncbi:hypothetical protein K3495_g198 [Podosphaera aphanis]|nr:hypothetical protein K3495_g198 [Podosphaera aphanis]